MKVPVAVNCCVAPALKLGFAGVTAMESKPAVVPVPERLVVCGLLLALSLTVRVPLRAPTTVGVKVTLTVHLPLLASELPQVLVWAKSPLAAMLVIDRTVV